MASPFFTSAATKTHAHGRRSYLKAICQMEKSSRLVVKNFFRKLTRRLSHFLGGKSVKHVGEKVQLCRGNVSKLWGGNVLRVSE